MDILLKYYGIDWLILVLVLVQMWLLGSKRKSGFLVGIIATCFGMVFSYMSGSVGNGALGLCLFFLHIRGYMRWRSAERFGPPRLIGDEELIPDPRSERYQNIKRWYNGEEENGKGDR